MGAGALKMFFTLVFVLGWGTGILMVLFMDQIESLFGEIGYTNPVFIFLVYSPGISGLILVYRHYGVEGVKSFFRRLTLWRMPSVWWTFLVLGIPAVFYLGALLKGGIEDPWPFSSWYMVFPALLAALMIGPMEEFGWHGVALPLLQRRMAPFWASVIVGAVWGLWHAPSFLLSGTPQSSWSFWPFFFGIVALSVILTPMVNAAAGSLLVAVLYHFQMNGPIWPDAQPWDNVLLIAIAAIVVVVCRCSMFSREGAVTEVLMPGDEEMISDARAPVGTPQLA
jgi:membrane protease YdiL (CAAX protease family)